MIDTKINEPIVEQSAKQAEVAFKDPYQYDFLLQRIYGFLRANNPNLGKKNLFEI
jgi:hypothetical protein